MLCCLTLSPALYLNPLSATVGGVPQAGSGEVALLTSRQARLSCFGHINRAESDPVMLNFSMKFDEGTCKSEEHEMAVAYLLK